MRNFLYPDSDSRISRLLAFGMLSSLGMTACGGSADPLGAPAVEPPLVSSLPAALKVSTASLWMNPKGLAAVSLSSNPLQQCSEQGEPSDSTLTGEAKLAATVYCRVFGKGPIEISSVTASVDSRMSEFDSRIQENSTTPECVGSALVSKTEALSFPLRSSAMEQKFQCKDALSDTSVTAFGKEENTDGGTTWYVYDGTNNPLATAAATSGKSAGQSQAWQVNVGADGNVVSEEGYITLAPQLMNCTGGVCDAPDTQIAGSSMLMHVLVDVTGGTVEATAAGAGIGFCAFHIKTSSQAIYLKGQLTNGLGSCATAVEEICLNATSFEVLSDATACDSLKTSLELQSIDRAEFTSGEGGPTTTQQASGIGTNPKSEMGTWIDYCLGPSDFEDVTALFSESSGG